MTQATIARNGYPKLTPDEAAAFIHDGDLVGFSGFTPAGAVKSVPLALAERARTAHDAGEPFQLRVLTGASTGPALDDALAEADAIAWRAPYQSSRPLRSRINEQRVKFVDMHLSHVPQVLEFGFFGNLDMAVVEATDVTHDGRVYLTTSVGVSPSMLHNADKVILEVNARQSIRLSEMHDILVLPNPPHRGPIPIHEPMTKIGTPFIAIDPKKILGVVETDQLDGIAPFSAPDEKSRRIAEHVVRFLTEELREGRIPAGFLPIQSGVGNIANAVMNGLGNDPNIPPFFMYTEVFQDALVQLMEAGQLRGASTAAITLSDDVMTHVFDNMDFFAPRIVMRPQELSNNPGVVRRLGVVSINTVLEMDIYGNANSTHVCGTRLMNGSGGSGDFVRNAYLSILVAPSVAKGGAISAVVPMVTHVDHNEHSVQILVTEHGLADLRGLGPVERANRIIDRCAHPAYRPYLREYLETAPVGHIRHDLGRCFELHRNLIEQGAMLPGVEVGAA